MASVGIGVYLLSVIWFAAFMLVFISVRTGHSLGAIAVWSSALFSFLIYSLPKVEIDESYIEKFYQTVYSVRNFTIAVVLLGTVVGTAYSYYISNNLEPLEYRKIRSFGS